MWKFIEQGSAPLNALLRKNISLHLGSRLTEGLQASQVAPQPPPTLTRSDFDKPILLKIEYIPE